MMNLEALLDDGSRGLAQLLGGILAALVLLLAVAVFVPVAIVAGTVRSVDMTARSTVAERPAGMTLTAGHPPAQRPGSSAVEATARKYLGVPYVFGGTDPSRGLDCSGLVQLVFHNVGITLPRTAQLQYNATAHVSREQLQPGDLVFFARTYAEPNDWITHVGIYIGDGLQINAPTEGQVVSIQPVFTGFWGEHFVSGGRVVAR